MANFIMFLSYMIFINVLYLYAYSKSFFNLYSCFGCEVLEWSNQSYDYIVVGAGTAGSIVAQRLATNGYHKILLLEAGPECNAFTAPIFGIVLQNSFLDWNYKTVPQADACKAFRERRSRWPMGKVVGGTSKLNNMIYIRGHVTDYQNWFKGSGKFNYDSDIRPFFERLENSGGNTGKDAMVISKLGYRSILSDIILQTAFFMGLSVTDDMHPNPGFYVPKVTMKDGQRYTSSEKLHSYPNIVLRSNALVTEILFENDFEASGVKYEYLGHKYRIKAKRGIILSAGVIGTPKLLMLSGIGPSNHLRNMGIKIKSNLPVGENLHDHVATGFDLVLLNKSIGLDLKTMMYPTAIFDWMFNSKGPWTTIGCENLIFINQNDTTPDLQFMVLPMGITSDYGLHLQRLVGLRYSIWDNYFDRIDKTSISILPIVTHPKSRGHVRLRSKNPHDMPLIDPKYLTSRYDVDKLLDGIEVLKKMIRSEPFQKLGAHLNPLVFPGCEGFKFDTRPYWECYVRHLTLTVFHPVGTCSIGTVVDYNFQVKRTNKLYVVDGSVIPTITVGNPQASIMMLAVKAVESIRNIEQMKKAESFRIEALVPKNTC